MKNIIKVFCLFALMFASIIQAKAVVNSVKVFRGGGSAQTQFEVPFPESFTREVLSNDKLFIQLIPGVKQWKVLNQSGASQTARCTMSMSSLINPSTYLVQVNKVSDNEIRFKRLSGDLNELEGSWTISRGSKPNSTLVTYKYTIDTGMKLVPKGLMEQELKKHLVETQNRVKIKVQEMYEKNTQIGMSRN